MQRALGRCGRAYHRIIGPLVDLAAGSLRQERGCKRCLAVEHFTAASSGGDEAGVAENGEVLRDGCRGEAHPLGQAAGCAGDEGFGQHGCAPSAEESHDRGWLWGGLPELRCAMRRIADLYPGEAKTDARDAAVIADAARTMPHTLRGIELTDETIAELEMIVGFDDDLAGEATRIANRLRGLLTQIHPHLER